MILTTRKIWLCVNGVLVLIATAILAWIFDTFVLIGVDTMGLSGAIMAVGLVTIFFPIVFLNNFGIAIIKGKSDYINKFDDAGLRVHAFFLFVLTALISLLYFGAKQNELISAGLPKSSILGYGTLLAVSYVASFLVDFFKKHPLK